MKRIFYIILFIASFSFSSNAQVKPANANVVKVVKFYPNPAINFINFEFDKSSDNSYTLYIFNFIGKKVQETPVTSQKVTVSLNDLYRGVYIYQLRDKQNAVVASGKFQIAK